ncbi:MAG: outer membrane protein assembly factor BamD [FCB group bacterium]|nr:outer membrane protein assembly factor BamD [FCB group bacterium]
MIYIIQRSAVIIFKRFVLAAALVLLLGCVYYNTFYNAEQSFGKALKIIEDSPAADDEVPAGAKKLLDSAIEKSNIVLQKFPESKYVDDAYYIIGQASFLKGDNTTAERYFNKLLSEYPDSPYQAECNIWLAYAHFKMGYVDSAQTRIKDILNLGETRKSDKYLLYKIMGEIQLEKDSLNNAFLYLQKAADFANTDSKRSYIYGKLVSLAENNNDLESAIGFLEQLQIFSTNDQVKEDAKFKWIEYNRQIGNFNIVLEELDKMLQDSNNERLYLTLELERAKTLIAGRDFVDARIALDDILANKTYQRKPKTADACYLLGKLAFTEDFDLPLALTFLDSVSRISTRSNYKTEVRDLTKKIEKYQNLLAEFDAVSSAGVPEETESSVDEMEPALADSTDRMPLGYPSELSDSKSGPAATPDSLLFTVSEMLLFEFQQTDRALEYYQELVKDYPDSKFVPQSLFVLQNFSRNGDDRWGQILKERFPTSVYALGFQDSTFAASSFDPLDSLRDAAWQLLPASPTDARAAFDEIATKNEDDQAAYIAAFITDNYLNDLNETIRRYQEFLEQYPDSKNTSIVTKRLDELREAIEERKAAVVGWVDHYYRKLGIRSADSTLFVMGNADTILTAAKLDSISLAFGPSSVWFFGDMENVYQKTITDSLVIKKTFPEVSIVSADSSMLVYADADTFLQASWQQTLILSAGAKSQDIRFSNDSLLLSIMDNTPLYDIHEFDEQLALLAPEEAADTTQVDSSEVARQPTMENPVLDSDTALIPDSALFAQPPAAQLVGTPDSLSQLAGSPDTVKTDFQPGEMTVPEKPVFSSDSLTASDNLQAAGEEVIQPLPGSGTPPLQLADSAAVSEKSDLPVLQADTLLTGRSADIGKDTLQVSTGADSAAVPDSMPEFDMGKIDTVEVSEISKADDSILTPDITEPSVPSETFDTVWKNYLIKPGDMLTGIAKKEYQDYSKWVDIYEWNRTEIGDNPNLIYPFHELRLLKKTTDAIEIAAERSVHIVQSGETLWSIAETVYHDPRAWIILYLDNTELIEQNKGLLQPGMKLVVRSSLK